jgi:glycosyltransferase involved in cell wall biosynthesis
MTVAADGGRRLRVAMIAPPWFPVPPPAYGGIESVVALLSDALVGRGHRVDLFCAPGSTSRATVRPLLGPRPDCIERSLIEVDHVARALAAIDDAGRGDMPFDVVHDHGGYTALAMADRVATPIVHTVHGPFDDDARSFYAQHGRKGVVVCISRAQAIHAPAGARVAAVVPNPLDLAHWPVRDEPREHLLWIGRMHPVKGPHLAIRVARACGVPLVLAGPVQPGFREFFAREVEPHIDGAGVRFAGEVGVEAKQRLYAQARALLMPIRWPEPFGMVMIEALASGTPVLSFAAGAAPEIVAHGLTGFLVRDEHEMAAMVEPAGRLDRSRCRASVAARWTPDSVAAGYERVYRAALPRATRGVAGPAA